MIDVTIDISVLDELRDQFSDEIMTNITAELESYAKEVLQDETPKDTGNLADNWEISIDGTEIYMVNHTSYALYVLNGTKPHDIYSRYKSVLAFQMNGTTMFAKHVRHPGTKPNDYVGRAIRTIESNYEEIINNELYKAGVSR